MPFRVKNFQSSIELNLDELIKSELVQACTGYVDLTKPQEKIHHLRGMMEMLEQEVDIDQRQAIMKACGRSCIGKSVIDKALRLQTAARNLEDLLDRLNQAHIGGGHLRLDGDVIHAAYDRCYCGSVSKTREVFSSTYCYCSCGWYQKLFEELLKTPVAVELLGSIIQGDERCQFVIHLQEGL